VPLLVALVVLVNVVGNRSGSSSGPVADVSGPTTPARDHLPVVTVQTPPVTPQADASCPALVDALPADMVGESSRRVESASPYVRAWGNPAVVMICGVDRPEKFVVGTSVIQINGVQWFVDTSDPDATVWTAVDRPVYVEVQVPSSSDSAGVTELTVPIAKNLDQQDPDPAG
jgi:Protein of unknown function (DUF3515)